MTTAVDENIFKAKAREWAQTVVRFSNTPVPPDMEAQKQSLLKMAKNIKSKVEAAAGPLDYLSPMNQLEFVPVIVAGAVAVAASAIGYWYYDYNKFMAKIADRNSLIASGLSPQQAANISAQSDGGVFSNVSQIVKYGAIGAALFFGAKYLRLI
jgi:hypothetical protein